MTEPATPQYVAGIGIGYAMTVAAIGTFWYFEIVGSLAIRVGLLVATIGLVVTVVRDEHIQAWLSGAGTSRTMPLVGSRIKCVRCREERPLRWLKHDRIRLMTGPNGNRLCREHHHEAWDEYMAENKEG